MMTLMIELLVVINRLVVTTRLVMFWRASAALVGNMPVLLPELLA